MKTPLFLKKHTHILSPLGGIIVLCSGAVGGFAFVVSMLPLAWIGEKHTALLYLTMGACFLLCYLGRQMIAVEIGGIPALLPHHIVETILPGEELDVLEIHDRLNAMLGTEDAHPACVLMFHVSTIWVHNHLSRLVALRILEEVPQVGKARETYRLPSVTNHSYLHDFGSGKTRPLRDNWALRIAARIGLSLMALKFDWWPWALIVVAIDALRRDWFGVAGVLFVSLLSLLCHQIGTMLVGLRYRNSDPFTEMDILAVMDYSAWLNIEQIKARMMLAKGMGDSSWEYEHCGPGMDWLEGRLKFLIEHGLVRVQEGQEPNALQEYQLTTEGNSRRSDGMEVSRAKQGRSLPGLPGELEHRM